MGLLQWFRRKVGGSVSTEGMMAVPTAQHYEKTEEEKFREKRGFGMAVEPMPWSDDIARRNKEVEEEYRAEIEARKAATLAGTYKPRFVVPVLTDDQRAQVNAMADEDAAYQLLHQFHRLRFDAIVAGAPIDVETEVNWDMEMTIDPGARANVTKDDSVKQAALTEVEESQYREIGKLHRAIALEEIEQGIARQDLTGIIGSDEEILAQCGGNEQLAAQVKAKGLELLKEARDSRKPAVVAFETPAGTVVSQS